MGQNTSNPRSSDSNDASYPGHDIDWRGVLKRVGPKLERYFKRRGLPITPHDVDDGIQEGILRVLEDKAIFEPEKGQFDTFFFVICKNQIVNILKSRWSPVDLDALRVYPQINPDDGVSKSDEQLRLCLDAVLERLPESDRDFVLGYSTMPVSEIAANHGITPDAARVRYYRLKARIKREIQGPRHGTHALPQARGAGNE